MLPSIIVTGGAGFIGSAVVRALLATERYRVVTLDAFTYAANPATLATLADNPQHRLVEMSINDGPRVKALLEEEQPQAILHLAAESHVDRSIDGPGIFVETNVNGTVTLLDCALAYWRDRPAEQQERFRFVHVSTDEVYGSLPLQGGERFSERSPLRPNSPYAASKAASDHMARAWYHTYGLPVVISNCSNNYGPYQFPEKLIPVVILAGMEGRQIPVYGKGENIRDWLHVADHAQALIALMEGGRPGETYLIGGDTERRNIDLVQALCAILDEHLPQSAHRPHGSLIAFVSDRPGHDLRYAVDSSKIKAELGWQARVSFDIGLQETVAWYLDNRDWWQPIREGRYRGERLGLGRQ